MSVNLQFTKLEYAYYTECDGMACGPRVGKWKTRKAGTGTGTEIRKRSSDAHMYNIIPL